MMTSSRGVKRSWSKPEWNFELDTEGGEDEEEFCEWGRNRMGRDEKRGLFESGGMDVVIASENCTTES